jgi:hypothetical protein
VVNYERNFCRGRAKQIALLVVMLFSAARVKALLDAAFHRAQNILRKVTS